MRKGKRKKNRSFPASRTAKEPRERKRSGGGVGDAARGGERKGQEGSVNYRRAKEARRDTAPGEEDRTER